MSGNGLGQIAQAIIAAQGVNQRAVQGQTKAVQSNAFKGGAGEADALVPIYNEYKRQMALDGRRPLPFAQWKIVHRNDR